MKLTMKIVGTVEITRVIACTDLVQNFTVAQLQNSRNKLPIGCLITCEGQNARYSFGADPTQGADGSGALGHTLYAGQSLELHNTRNIQDFRFINHTNGNNAVIQVSLMYEIGA